MSRTIDRALVAKMSDARERLSALVAQATRERRTESRAVWPKDLNAPESSVAKENHRG